MGLPESLTTLEPGPDGIRRCSMRTLAEHIFTAAAAYLVDPFRGGAPVAPDDRIFGLAARQDLLPRILDHYEPAPSDDEPVNVHAARQHPPDELYPLFLELTQQRAILISNLSVVHLLASYWVSVVYQQHIILRAVDWHDSWPEYYCHRLRRNTDPADGAYGAVPRDFLQLFRAALDRIERDGKNGSAEPRGGARLDPLFQQLAPLMHAYNARVDYTSLRISNSVYATRSRPPRPRADDDDDDADADARPYRRLDEAHTLPLETPGAIRMRVLLGLAGPAILAAENDAPRAIARLATLAELAYAKRFSFPGPALFSGGLGNTHESCVLYTIGDSRLCIANSYRDAYLLGARGSGLGINVSLVRENGARVASNNGTAHGVVPIIDGCEFIRSSAHQAGSRTCATSCFISATHPDFPDVLGRINSANPFGKTLVGCQVPQLLWRRACPEFFGIDPADPTLNGGRWSFFSPTVANLSCLWGEDFTERYCALERDGQAHHSLPAIAVVGMIEQALRSSGRIYVVNPDAMAGMCNHRDFARLNVFGCRFPIITTNLCTEVVLFSSERFTPTCSLSALNIHQFIRRDTATVDWPALERAVRAIVHYLLCLLICSPARNPEYGYVAPEDDDDDEARCLRRGRKLRNIGIGFQGLSRAFQMLGLPYDSATAREFAEILMRRIYTVAVDEAIALAPQFPMDPTVWKHTQTAAGKLHPHLCLEANAGNPHYPADLLTHCRPNTDTPRPPGDPIRTRGGETAPVPWPEKYAQWGIEYNSSIDDIPTLAARAAKHTAALTLFTVLMPTGTASVAERTSPCFEPGQLVCEERGPAGRMQCADEELVFQLTRAGVWSEDLCNAIIANHDSLQGLLPPEHAYLETLFRNPFEIDTVATLDLVARMLPYIDGAVSMNLFFTNPTSEQVLFALLAGADRNLKNLCYYARQRSPEATSSYFDLSRISSAAAEVATGIEAGVRRPATAPVPEPPRSATCTEDCVSCAL